MPARVRGFVLRQTKSRVPEVPEQETGAAALRVRRGGEERSGDPAVNAGGTMWLVRRRSRGGGLLAERPRLGPLFAIKNALRGTLSASFVFDSSYRLYIDTIYFLHCFLAN